MNDKTAKSIEKWESEKKILESVRRSLKQFIKLKNEKAGKEDVAKVNDKASALFEENKFIKMDWKEVKKSKASRDESLEKIEKKIADRKKKLDAAYAAESAEHKAEDAEGRDWTKEIENCAPEDIYYHWAYGKMEVVAMEGDYIYMKPLDKKGCRYDWIKKNNAIVEIDGREEEVKEFSVYSIGKWLYPNMEDVHVANKDMAHKMFAK